MKKPYFQVLAILTLLLLIYGVHFTGRSYNTTSTVDGLSWNLIQIGNSVDDDNNGYIDDWKGWDWGNHDNNPGWEENDKIDHHGTFITRLMAVNDDSIIGVAPNTTIMALRVVDQDTLIPNPDALKSAVDYPIENGADVIIMSLDLFIGPPGFRDSIRETFNKGIPTVAVAGNSDFGNESIVLPGSFSEVITVGASNIDQEKAEYSNIGGELDLIAPGGERTTMELKSSDIEDGYRYGYGTSYAAPHVAGIIALIKSIRSDLGVEDIRYILHTTATDIGPIGWDKDTGYGILNATASLELAFIFSSTTTVKTKTFWIFGTGYSNFLEFIGIFTLALFYINRKRKIQNPN